MTGENNTGGSRIVLRDSNEAQPYRTSGPSNQISERESDIMCMSLLPQLMFMTLIAVHEHEAPSDALKGRLGHIPPDLSSTAGGETSVRDQEGCKDQGMIVKRPPEALAEPASENDCVGQEVYGVMPNGKCS